MCESGSAAQDHEDWYERYRQAMDLMVEAQRERDHYKALAEQHENAWEAGHKAGRAFRSSQGEDLSHVSLPPETVRLVEALQAIRTFTGEGPHTRMGEACGVDACVGCLIFATANDALAAFPVSAPERDTVRRITEWLRDESMKSMDPGWRHTAEKIERRFLTEFPVSGESENER